MHVDYDIVRQGKYITNWENKNLWKIKKCIKNEHGTKMLVQYKNFPSQARLQWLNTML
jgi:hypothetical protein